ncbi:MAG: hypothetical protein RDV48_29130 [Candidatus Eremiobacteraeota bacterium]|nr:hypothetical protein [Candidatus Eremiobacteraeota bacterium]
MKMPSPALPRLILIVVLAVLAAAAIQPRAGTGEEPLRWRQIGPYWGDRFQVIVDPGKAGRLYCIGHGSIHRSDDEGDSWKPLYQSDMSLGTFLSFAFSLENHRTLFAGSSMTGFWRSDDGGASWSRKVKGLPSFEINHPATCSKVKVWPAVVSIAPAKDALYLGMSSPHETVSPVYRSRDSGETWEPYGEAMKARRSPERPAVCQLAFDRRDRLWAAIHEGGVYLLNEGRWEKRSQGLTGKDEEITFLLTDPFSSDRVRIGTRRGWIYETNDRGASWKRLPLPGGMNAGKIPLVYWMAADFNNPDLLWAGLSGSGTGVSNEQPLFVPDGDQGPGGIVVSRDGGRHWLWPVRSAYSGIRLTIDPNETYTDTWGKRSKHYFKTSGAEI